MEIIKSSFEELFIMEYSAFHDSRGEFVKTIHEDTFRKAGLEHVFLESYYSISKKDVIRGMHFQLPPYDHVKLVYVVTGSILDIVLDLRQNSETYGSFFSIILSSENRKGLYIGKGFAHGFLALEDNSTVEYHTSTCQSKEFEGGVKYDSFGYQWPVDSPIVSNRDLGLTCFSDLAFKF